MRSRRGCARPPLAKPRAFLLPRRNVLKTSPYVYGLLLLACVAAVWPVASSGSIPAFQQDWTWPLSRALSLQWLHSFAGLWDERGLGHANALPWQTYAVVTQVAAVLLFGSSLGLAVWLGAVLFIGACACVAMVRALGVTSQASAFCAALFYAAGPVVYTRVAAGHLAYVLAYALLPWIVVLAQRTIARRRWFAAVALGAVVGLAASQIQFLALAWLLVVPLAAFVPRTPGWIARVGAAAAVAVAVQLQAILPLVWSGTTALYAAQRALVSFEYNNSSPMADAPVMLGYFTHYYETAALPGAYWTLYAIIVVALVLALVARWRIALYALYLSVLGTLFTAGLYGPLSAPLAAAFESSPYATAFRDLHYFAAFTALGTALAVAIALDRFRIVAVPAAAAILWCALPVLWGSDVRSLLVPRGDVDAALHAMSVAHARGPGRVLWLPAEEPLGLRGSPNAGRDFTAYGPSANASVSDDRDNPQLAYALATLRDGKPNWSAFAALGIRYVAYRDDVRSGRKEDNLGTGFRLAYGRLEDEDLGAVLARDARLTPIDRSTHVALYELNDAWGVQYAATAVSADLYSQLAAHQISVTGAASPVPITASALTADPRLDWVAGRIGWRYAAWLPDSIAPFVWTVSRRPLAFAAANLRCVLAGAQPAAALTGDTVRTIQGPWKRYALAARPAGGVRVLPNGLAAVALRGCAVKTSAQPMLAMAGEYDAGWRLREGSGWVVPRLANGWMMAWPQPASRTTLLYLPAIAQTVGLIVALAILIGAAVIARRADARRSVSTS